MLIRKTYQKKEERAKFLASKFNDITTAKHADIKYSRDNRLSYRARGIMGYLFTHVDHWNPLQKDLVNKSESDGKAAIAQGVNELVQYGYMSKTKRHVDGRYEWETVAFEIALDNPDYNPKVHGVAYYASETISADEKENLETLLLSIIDTADIKPLDDFEQFFGKQDDPIPVDKAVAQDNPSGPAEHVLQIMGQTQKDLMGHLYSEYALMVYERFQDVKIKDQGQIRGMSKDENLALGCFLWAYNKSSHQDLPIPGALSDKKYWLKAVTKHLANYPLIQLQALYEVAIRDHLGENLDLFTPDSISKRLVLAYQTVKAHFLAKQASRKALDNALNQTTHEPDENEILQDNVELTLNWAKGKDGSVKNSNVMWRGVIFKTDEDKELVLDFYSQWHSKINHETESDMRALLEKGELILQSALPMEKLTDLFHFRTEHEDELLFQAFIFTQRATMLNCDLIGYRRQKNIPLSNNLETCPLPEFYQRLVNPAQRFMLETGAGRLNGLASVLGGTNER